MSGGGGHRGVHGGVLAQCGDHVADGEGTWGEWRRRQSACLPPPTYSHTLQHTLTPTLRPYISHHPFLACSLQEQGMRVEQLDDGVGDRGEPDQSSGGEGV